MRLRESRRALAQHPRAVLAVLLAFAIQILPLPGVVSHRHAGGAAGHTHVGRIAGATPRVGMLEDGARVHLQSAPARGLHHHVVQPTTAAPTTIEPPHGPVLVVVAVQSLEVRDLVPALAGPSQARAPPSRVV